jgi:hypothetical protein
MRLRVQPARRSCTIILLRRVTRVAATEDGCRHQRGNQIAERLFAFPLTNTPQRSRCPGAGPAVPGEQSLPGWMKPPDERQQIIFAQRNRRVEKGPRSKLRRSVALIGRSE